MYWEQIVWPAYVAAHQGLFENGDVERGKLLVPDGGRQGAEKPGAPVRDLVVFEHSSAGMAELVTRASEQILKVARFR